MDFDLKGFLAKVVSWADSQEDIGEVLLVGSHAKEAANPNSDVDLVILSAEPKQYFDDIEWLRQFGDIEGQVVEDWGNVKSLRAWFAGGLEVEFGFTHLNWIAKPIDLGTRKVLADGYRILFDRNGRLASLEISK